MQFQPFPVDQKEMYEWDWRLQAGWGGRSEGVYPYRHPNIFSPTEQEEEGYNPKTTAGRRWQPPSQRRRRKHREEHNRSCRPTKPCCHSPNLVSQTSPFLESCFSSTALYVTKQHQHPPWAGQLSETSHSVITRCCTGVAPSTPSHSVSTIPTLTQVRPSVSPPNMEATMSPCQRANTIISLSCCIPFNGLPLLLGLSVNSLPRLVHHPSRCSMCHAKFLLVFIMIALFLISGLWTLRTLFSHPNCTNFSSPLSFIWLIQIVIK